MTNDLASLYFNSGRMVGVSFTQKKKFYLHI